jgi:hypothetical protein
VLRDDFSERINRVIRGFAVYVFPISHKCYKLYLHMITLTIFREEHFLLKTSLYKGDSVHVQTQRNTYIQGGSETVTAHSSIFQCGFTPHVNPLMPIGHYSGRTALLTSR